MVLDAAAYINFRLSSNLQMIRLVFSMKQQVETPPGVFQPTAPYLVFSQGTEKEHGHNPSGKKAADVFNNRQ